jgi:hypothetical protein
VVVHCGGLELDLLMAAVGASEDHVSGLRAEGVLAIVPVYAHLLVTYTTYCAAVEVG